MKIDQAQKAIAHLTTSEIYKVGCYYIVSAPICFAWNYNGGKSDLMARSLTDLVKQALYGISPIYCNC